MEKLFTIMIRLLSFSGAQVKEISKSNDGYVFDGEIDGEEYRVFITKKSQHQYKLIEETAENWQSY